MNKQRLSVLELIGNTPMVEVRRLETGPCRLFLKLENQNPGGSIKDRVALAMIEAAERDGQLQKNSLIVEATAGNTGLGLALVAAQKGYRLLIVVPDKMSQEKIFHLKAMGAEVVLTRSDVTKGHPEYYQDMAARLAREKSAFYVNQFGNPANPKAHEETTGPEIWEQMDHKVDAVVAAVGTGGTITGLSRYFERVSPRTEMVLADPVGSIVADVVKTGKPPEKIGTWLVEGHRRGLHSAGVRPLAREAGLQHPGRGGVRRLPRSAQERRNPRRHLLRHADRRRAALLPRAEERRSAWSRWSATAATSTCPRCTTTTGCSTRASSSARPTATCATSSRAATRSTRSPRSTPTKPCWRRTSA